MEECLIPKFLAFVLAACIASILIGQELSNLHAERMASLGYEETVVFTDKGGYTKVWVYKGTRNV